MTKGRKKASPTVNGKGKAIPTDMLGMLTALVDQIGEVGPETDLDRAQDKIFEAYDAPTVRKRLALAREALAISPLCVDAYNILAEDEKTPAEAAKLYRKGVEAGRKVLGDMLEEDAGMFWGLIETRPYMRALHGLAATLQESGEIEEAIELYGEMLALNPNDNQGARYLLMDCLLILGRDADAEQLLKRYKDDGSGAWAWSRALLRFRQKGDSALARKALEKAMVGNRHVPAYLLGKKKMPKRLPEYISWGGEDEAIAYASDSAAAWHAAPGALDWLHSRSVEAA